MDGETPVDNWFIRGPHGQIKWVVDEDGHISNYIGYGSNGNRIVTEGDWPPHIEPVFLDNDVLFPGFPQMKLAAGTAQDMTQQLGPLDTAGVSGLAGLGASANPDTAPGGNATFLQPALGRGMLPGAGLSDWIEKEQHPIPGFDPWKDVLGDTAPPQAPPAVQDAATDADFRLAAMWREQEYYGAKPGAQQGSPWVDDLRNPRLPLPRRIPVGGWSPGFDWLERERHMAPDVRPPEWGGPTPRPRRGPAPLLPNPSSSGDEDGGTTEPRSSADDALQNAYDAQDPWNDPNMWNSFGKMMADPYWGTAIMLPAGLLKGGLTIGGRLVFAGASKIGLAAKAAQFTDEAVSWVGRGLKALGNAIERAISFGGRDLAFEGAGANGISTGVKLLDDLGNAILRFGDDLLGGGGRGGKLPNELGKLGEQQMDDLYRLDNPGVELVKQPTIRLQNGRIIRPDAHDPVNKVYLEAKLRKYLPFNEQLRTYATEVKKLGSTLQVWVKKGAETSKQLKQAAKEGILELIDRLIK